MSTETKTSPTEMTEFFTHIYDTNEWVGSGGGSTKEFCHDYTRWLKAKLQEHQITSVVDIGCGDWQHSPDIYEGLDLQYTGYDCVQSVIDANKAAHPKYHFECVDVHAKRASLPSADVYLIKDVIQHWNNQYTREFLDTIFNKAKYVITINSIPTSNNCNADGAWGRPLDETSQVLKPYFPVVVHSFHNKKVIMLHRSF